MRVVHELTYFNLHSCVDGARFVRYGVRTFAMTDYLDQPLFGSANAPHSLGQYALRHVLGASASCTVFSGRVPEEGRDVAVSLFLALRSRGPEARARLLAEAQGWGRLDHPNVARIIDVGTFSDPGDASGRRSGIYTIRTLLGGMDLQRWLDTLPANAEPSTVQQVVDLFCAAGRGLAAAHRAGLVHRDFRPVNVVVGYDGRAQLVDFASADAVPLAPSSNDEHPRHPAPELRAGAAADALSDQFSFCAALSQALDRLSGARVSRRVRDALTRGMAEAPEDRWPSMDELLRALDRGQSGLLRVLTAVGLRRAS
jgi:eukaryotic-like serine/threonine-protein kinase